MATTTPISLSLKIEEHNGTYRSASSDEILHAAFSVINRRFRKGKVLSSPAESQHFLKLRLAHLEHEVFAVLWLDTRHRVLGFEELFAALSTGSACIRAKSSNPPSSTMPPPASWHITILPVIAHHPKPIRH